VRRYIHGDGADELVASYEGAGFTTRYYLHADERGSVVAVSDASGAALGTSNLAKIGLEGVGWAAPRSRRLHVRNSCYRSFLAKL